MSNAVTEEVTDTFAARGARVQVGLGLVVAWCRDEPGRVGEILYVPPGDERVWVFGRSRSTPSRPGWVRADLFRQRPGALQTAAPLEMGRLSREQLTIQRMDERGLLVENVGKRPLFARGVETQQAVVRPGEVLALEGICVFLCVERPPLMTPLVHAAAASWPAFGEADRDGWIGESEASWRLRDAIAFLRKDSGHVLIHGAIGSGKGLVAKAIAGEVPVVDVEGIEGPLRWNGPVILDGLDALDGLDGLTGRALAKAVAQSKHRVIAVVEGGLEAIPLELRSAFRHTLEVPDLDQRRDDLPLLIGARVALALAEEPSLAARFVDDEGVPRIAPDFVEEVMRAPLDAGMHSVDAAIWRALAETGGAWIKWVKAGAPPPARAEPAPRAPPEAIPASTPEVPELVELPPQLEPSVVAGLPTLTRAERIVLQHLALNQTSREIAKTLFVSVRTVQNHRARICDKLGLRGNNRLLAVALQLKRYLGPPPPS